MDKYDVIVIGAGAAGLMAAGLLSQNGVCVALLDKNQRPGRKIMITGKGRCNVTNDCDADTFLKSVKTNPRFLYSAISYFSSQDTMRFFEDHGVPLKVERGKRVFPQSDKAVDIVDALCSFIRNNNCSYKKCRCIKILSQDEKINGVLLEDGTSLFADKVILATGGMSYPLTGSTGDGYKMAKELGHEITSLKPSLISIIAKESYCKEMMGLSLKNVRLTLIERSSQKKAYEEIGEMLFTHFGISGPLVLSASSHMVKNCEDYQFFLDLKPGLDEKHLDDRILRDFEKFSNKDFINALHELLPRKMIPVIVKLSGIPANTKVNQITHEQRKSLVNLLKCFPVTPNAFRPIEEAIITSGGVQTKQITPKTMESRLVKGLYFAGEIIDVDAYTGGFNLQIAFSTAYTAAKAILEELGVYTL